MPHTCLCARGKQLATCIRPGYPRTCVRYEQLREKVLEKVDKFVVIDGFGEGVCRTRRHGGTFPQITYHREETVVRKDGHSEFGTWGKRSEDGAKVTEDTLFNIGSCSKAFVAASLGILIEEFAQGRNTTLLPASLSTLSWQTKLADILPGDWELTDPWASKKANLIDILSHVSGMPSHNTVEQMYMVGAHVITALSGVQFVEFVKDRILKPLRMTQSTYSVNEAIRSGKTSETWTNFGRLFPMDGRLEIGLLAGPGGLISNVRELQQAVGHFYWLRLGWTRSSLAGHDLLHHTSGAPGVSADITIPSLMALGRHTRKRRPKATCVA
ncbi:beta-lactamase/transpeptidase-like protein [Lactarius quietus]|nr:beta-lactamase/transpeptidase-like protein [Lactarius quietus]